MGEAPLPQRARGYWKARFSAAGEGLEKLLEAERAQLAPWAVVGLGSGIAAWFALGEPGQWSAFLCVSAALALVGFAIGRRSLGKGARLVRARGGDRLCAGLATRGRGRAAAADAAGGRGTQRDRRDGRSSRREGSDARCRAFDDAAAAADASPVDRRRQASAGDCAKRRDSHARPARSAAADGAARNLRLLARRVVSRPRRRGQAARSAGGGSQRF